MSAKCSCGRPVAFKECCGPLLSHDRDAEDPETLMRSRYSAFVHKDVDYLYETLDPQARHDFDRKATEQWANEADFMGLEILKSSFEGNKGTVEFKATFMMEAVPGEGKKEHIHHELSKFRKQAGIWYFRDAKVFEQQPEAPAK